MRSESMMGRRCEDCGNQAKKECVYMRCRTCCKSKGFQCQTHIKSTWVPAYRRRQRQQQQQQQQQPQQQQQQALELPVHHHHHHYSTTNPKRLREGLGKRPSHFPEEVKTTAVFRCVRVSSVDDDRDRYGYQTRLNIGGHIFRGILYHQPPHHLNQHLQAFLLPSSPFMTTPNPFTHFVSGTEFSPHHNP